MFRENTCNVLFQPPFCIIWMLGLEKEMLYVDLVKFRFHESQHTFSLLDLKQTYVPNSAQWLPWIAELSLLTILVSYTKKRAPLHIWNVAGWQSLFCGQWKVPSESWDLGKEAMLPKSALGAGKEEAALMKFMVQSYPGLILMQLMLHQCTFWATGSAAAVMPAHRPGMPGQRAAGPRHILTTSGASASK